VDIYIFGKVSSLTAIDRGSSEISRCKVTFAVRQKGHTARRGGLRKKERKKERKNE